MSRELKRSGKLSYMDTLSTELAGSTTPAAVILFVACRLRRRWSELGGWYAEMADTRFHPLDCACWNLSSQMGEREAHERFEHRRRASHEHPP